MELKTLRDPMVAFIFMGTVAMGGSGCDTHAGPSGVHES